jgi:hypothetical protein
MTSTNGPYLRPKETRLREVSLREAAHAVVAQALVLHVLRITIAPGGADNCLYRTLSDRQWDANRDDCTCRRNAN